MNNQHPQQEKILLIDSNNMFFRSYCASPMLSSKGHHVGGITGYLYSLQKVIKEVRPHKVFNIWDGRGGSSKRKDINKNYKDGRKVPKPIKMNRAIELDEEQEKQSCYYQQARLIELLNFFPFPQLCEEGVEADDFISYMCNHFSCKENFIKIIVSNDKDFIQLLDECTILYRPCEEKYITMKSHILQEKVHPKNMALSRAIEGDNSDNLRGIKGVGRKTITKIFKQFSDSEFITLDRLKELCKEKEEDCLPAQKILKDFKTVEENYQIMQLYSPMIHFNAKQKVDEQIKEYNPKMSVSEFNQELRNEGIIGTSFRELINHSQRIVMDWNIKQNGK
jgi:DNA polymerase-1